jgi:F-type H+-transporting ATPase subunit b
VLDTIAKRRSSIEQTLASAQAAKDEAEDLQTRYENRLEQWNAEREAARDELRREIAEERMRRLELLEQELEREREKARALEEKLHEDTVLKYQEAALTQGERFVVRLLSELAGPDLEARLFDMALRELDKLPTQRLDAIRLACEEAPEAAEVATTYPLDAARKHLLADKLSGLLGMPVACRFSEDPSLLAGLHVTLGPWVFQANLRDEIKGFAASAHETF